MALNILNMALSLIRMAQARKCVLDGKLCRHPHPHTCIYTV